MVPVLLPDADAIGDHLRACASHVRLHVMHKACEHEAVQSSVGLVLKTILLQLHWCVLPFWSPASTLNKLKTILLQLSQAYVSFNRRYMAVIP